MTGPHWDEYQSHFYNLNKIRVYMTLTLGNDNFKNNFTLTPDLVPRMTGEIFPPHFLVLCAEKNYAKCWY